MNSDSIPVGSILQETPFRERDGVLFGHFLFLVFVKHLSVDFCWINKSEVMRPSRAGDIKLGIISIFMDLKPQGE